MFRQKSFNSVEVPPRLSEEVLWDLKEGSMLSFCQQKETYFQFKGSIILIVIKRQKLS